MKNKYFFLAVSVFYIFFIACSDRNKSVSENHSKTSGGLRTIKVNNLNNDSLLYLSHFIKDVKLIQLELTADCILGDISKVIFFDDHFYITDRQNEAGVFEFDEHGKFIKIIGTQGKGPTEHVVLTGFSINEKTKSLYIFDNVRQYVIEYNLDGKFVREIPIDRRANNFIYKDARFYFYKHNSGPAEDYDLFIKDMEGKTVAHYFKSISGHASRASRVFSIGGGELFVEPAYCDTVFSIRKDSLYYSYYIDLGKYKIAENDRRKMNEEPESSLHILLQKQYATSANCILKVKDLIYFYNTFNLVDNFSFYNIKTKEISTAYSILDDISYLDFCGPVSQPNDALIGVYSPTSLNNNVKTIKYLVKEKKFSEEKGEEVISTLTHIIDNGIDNMNLFLVMYYVK